MFTKAGDEASAILAHANEQHDKLLASAGKAGDELRRTAAEEADRLLAEADGKAQQLRAAADNEAADVQAQAELVAQRTEKTAQARADAVHRCAVEDAERLVNAARERARSIASDAIEEAHRLVHDAKAESERVLADAKLKADRLTADANRYADARMNQALANSKELQEQAVTDVAAGRQFRQESEELRSAAAALREQADKRLADASTRTAARIHRKTLRRDAKQARKQARPQKQTGTELRAVHRLLIALIILGAVVIAAIGFTGSYGAVRDLARAKGFGDFAEVLPIGVDAGIGVLLALDLLLTWLRMPLPMLRHAAWTLTGATVWFNAAASWPDPLGVGLHMAMPVLFVIVVEAARHAIGRLADVEAKEHTQTPKLIRWALAFRSTCRLWRRQHVWTVRDLSQAIEDEGQRLVYIRQLQTKHRTRWARTRKGTGWRQLATKIDLMPLDLYDAGVAFPEALRRAQKAATTGAPVDVTAAADERHESAAKSRHESATKTTKRSATERPKKSSKKRPEGATRAEARDALRALYDSLGRRPQEGELIAELKRIKSQYDSRQYANKLRAEIEQQEPHLAALGADNITPLTGS